MSEYGHSSEEHAPHVSSPISVPWVVAAALISATGILSLWWGAEQIDWPYFVIGTLLVLVAVLMFLNDRAGLDHA
ncbi:MAG: hypothetical protein WB947_06185 [Thermoplasmata archaeon]